MDWAASALILAGALVGGFVNGLTGFGTGLTALPLWLLALEPIVAAQLVCVGSITGHLSAFSILRHEVDWRGLAPMVIAGLIGVPAGVWLLQFISVPAFKLTVGAILILYCGFMLVAAGRVHVTRGGAAAEAGVGLIGGVLGGIAGLCGPPPIIWSALKSWPKDKRRRMLHAFNASVLSAMLATSLLRGLVDMRLVIAAAIALPATLAGTWLGERMYRRLDDRRFDRIVLVLLFCSGLILVGSNR